MEERHDVVGQERWHVWITGAAGLIGNALVDTARRFVPGARITGLTRQDVELTDGPAVRALANKHRPTHIIHCAALSRSPVCQSEPARAFACNVEATVNLARIADQMPFVFFSSDLVFDGRKGNYHEWDPANPLSVYGETKAVAERRVLENPAHTVIRTSLNSGNSPSGRRSIEEDLRAAWRSGHATRLFVDEFRCPIPAALTAEAVWRLLLAGATGVYHVAGSERLSRWEMGELVATHTTDCEPRTERASLAEYQGAPRPADCSLNLSKLEQRLRWRPPAWSACLTFPPHSPQDQPPIAT